MRKQSLVPSTKYLADSCQLCTKDYVLGTNKSEIYL